MRVGWQKIIDVLKTDKNRWFTKDEIQRMSDIPQSQINRELASMRYNRRLLYKDVSERWWDEYIYIYRDGCEDDKTCFLM